MKLKELGKDVEVEELPYGIFLGDPVCFARANGRYYVNMTGSEDGFRAVNSENYDVFHELFNNPGSIIGKRYNMI